MEAFASSMGETLMDGKPQPRNNKKRTVILAVILGLVVAVGGVFFFMKSKKAPDAAAATKSEEKKNGNGKEKAPVPVSISEAAIGPISSYISATSNLLAENEVKVLAETDGRLTQLLVDEGSRVSQGQMLAAINPEDARMSFAKAQVRATNARAAFNRAKGMHDQSLISQGDFDKTSMEKDVAEQELGEAQFRLAKTTIRAPFTGVITSRKVTLGQHVKPGEEMFTVTDFDPLVSHIYLPEKDVMGLQAGRPVRLVLKAAQDVQFNGRIRYISSVVDASTGTVKLTIEAVNPPAFVRPGGFVSVDIVRETRDKALVVPREALIREMQSAHLFVVEGDVAKKRDVTLGLEESGKVEVSSGLKPGEKVITAGQGALKDGSKVKVL